MGKVEIEYVVEHIPYLTAVTRTIPNPRYGKPRPPIPVKPPAHEDSIDTPIIPLWELQRLAEPPTITETYYLIHYFANHRITGFHGEVEIPVSELTKGEGD